LVDRFITIIDAETNKNVDEDVYYEDNYDGAMDMFEDFINDLN